MQYEIKPLIREEAEELDNKFYEYHDQMAVVRDGAPDNEDFVLKIVDEDGKIIAGLIGEFCNWEQMEIGTLWVDERYRGQGLGSLLLNEAERMAKQKGCYLSILGSLSFEGHGFYKKHGYTVYKDVVDWPRGCHNYSLSKRLDEDVPRHVPTQSAEGKFEILEGTEEDGEFIDDALEAYEQSFVPDAHDYVKLNRKIVDADGHILAGIIAGVTGWDGCFIHSLWVEEPYRKQGLGRALVEQVEKEAKENGAYMMLTFTYDWSVGFVRKCGYEDAGTLYDHPRGHSMTCFRKLL